MRAITLQCQAMRRSARLPARWALAALALAVPGHAAAAPGEASAIRDEAAGYEREIDEAEDADQRSIATFEAIDAWLRAFAVDGNLTASCAARAVLTRALADERLDVRARDELRQRFDHRAATAGECRALEAKEIKEAEAAPSIALIDPEGPAAGQTLAVGDRPRRSSRTIAGASLLALSAPAIGGLIYAALADAAIRREVSERQATLEDTGEHHEARIADLEVSARRALGLEIGLGVAAAGLVGAGVGLLVTGRRDRGPRSLSIAPNARVDFGGVVLSGRF